MDLKTTQEKRLNARELARAQRNISYLTALDLLDDIATLLEEVEDYQASFDLRWKADVRAVERWRAVHPDKERVWPDHADLCVWLINELERKGDTQE